MPKLTKKLIIEKIKYSAENHNEPFRCLYKGVEVAFIYAPTKTKYTTWKDYFEEFEIECRNNGEFLLSVNLGFAGRVNILLDNIIGI